MFSVSLLAPLWMSAGVDGMICSGSVARLANNLRKDGRKEKGEGGDSTEESSNSLSYEDGKIQEADEL